MQLFKTLVGAVIGGALGIAAMIAVQYFTGFDKAWLAILVAVFVGLGVRALVSTHGHASYFRGAITAILVLAAYYGGTELYSELANRGILAKEIGVVRPADVAEGEVDAEEQPEGDAEVAAAEPVLERRELAIPEGAAPRGWPPEVPAASIADYIAMIIAALVGYELGRGTSASKSAQRDPEDTPAGEAS